MNNYQALWRSQGIAFLFPGQGSQHVGMARELTLAYPAAQAVMDEADDILGFGLSRLCYEGPEAVLTDTVNAQPALLTVSTAVLAALTSELGDSTLSGESGAPCVAAGHSMGEYSALVAVGSLEFADALRLVRTRGELMKKAGEQSPGMMAAVLGLDEEQVAAICLQATQAGGVVQVANDNCPGQIVISGERTGMERALDALTAAGAKKIVPLAVSIAAHSPLMQPAADELAGAIDATPIAPPRIPVIGNTTATLLVNSQAIRQELTAQLTGSVRWTASIQAAASFGIGVYAEIGAGDVLAGLVKRIDRKSTRYTTGNPENLRAFVKAMRQPRVE